MCSQKTAVFIVAVPFRVNFVFSRLVRFLLCFKICGGLLF